LKRIQITSDSYQFTGKSLPPVSLEHDLKEFWMLLPTDMLFEVSLDYLHHDEEVKEFIVYLQSEEFPMIHRFIEHLKEHTEMRMPVRRSSIQRGV
jgi:2-C-methyl-D-erythritol 4-phosphate cytidylyltransferase